ncbi:MAG TPA: hypothetical protein VMS22_09045 [Candidatus Eisenbacteria bacterium]|nr:hypothetical protein [Candidatus Eisenbacteria bacterium]
MAFPSLRPLSVVVLVGVLSGCARQVPYQPNDAVLEGMTRAQREQAFVETLSRALKPRIVQAWIDDASYGYDAAVTIRDGFGIPTGYYGGRRRVVYFANIRELRLYTNNAVFVVDTSGRTVDKLVYAYTDDAQRMIDLMAAYRARRYSGASQAEPQSPGRPHRAWRPPPYDQQYDPRGNAPPPGYDDQSGPDDGNPPDGSGR